MVRDTVHSTTPDNPDDARDQALLLTRRAVLRGFAASTLGTFAMAFVPHVEGTNLVPFLDTLGPETAYADGGDQRYSFEVVGADQVGFQILDVSQTDEKGNYLPVKDATITLIKYSALLHPDPKTPPPTVSGTTGADGKVIIPITPVCFDLTPKDNVFEATCAISVTTEKARLKMRDFSAGLVTLVGASGVIIATHEVDSHDVYLERCTFDDWDIHYTKKTFYRGKHNNATHEVRIHVRGVTEDTEVSLEVIDAADQGKPDPTPLIKKKTTTARYDADKGYAEASWKGQYLQKGHGDCIKKDEVIFRIGYAGLTEDIRFSIVDVPTEEVNLTGGLIPFTTDAGSIFTFSMGNDLPCFNNCSFSVLNPSFPLQMSVTPSCVSIGIGTNVSMKDPDTNQPSLSSWKYEHEGNLGERYDRIRRDQDARFENFFGSEKKPMPSLEGDEEDSEGNPIDTTNKTVGKKSKFLNNYDFNLIARIVLNLAWCGLTGDTGGKEKGEWSGAVTGELGFSAEGTTGLRSFTVPPFYATLTLNITVIFAYTAQVSYVQAERFSAIDCNKLTYKTDSVFSIFLNINLKVSLGVGVPGVFSLSFDSTFSFPILFAWGEDDTGSWPSPHTVISMTILLEVVFQCMLMRFSGQIYAYKKENWYNNWINGVEDTPALTGDAAWGEIEPRFRLTHPDGTFRHTRIYANDGQLLQGSVNPFDDMIPVLESMMQGSHEADATKISTDDLDAIDMDVEAARFRPVSGVVGVFVRDDDGTVVCTDKIPRAYVRDDGTIGTELVDCAGVNTFLFGDEAAEMIAQASDGSDVAEAEDADEGAMPDEDAVIAEAEDADEGAMPDEDAVIAEAEDADEGAMPDEGSSTAEAEGAVVLPDEGAVIAEAALPDDGAAPDDGALPDDGVAPDESEGADDVTPLASQDESAVFRGDPLLGFALGVSEEYRYTPVPGKTTGAYCGDLGVKGIAAHDGVEPSIDKVIFEGVHSDPRQRVVEIGGVPYLFRVVTVAYPIDGEMRCRTRVVASAYDTVSCKWGNPKVIEYNSGDNALARRHTFDYDFDIVVRSGDDPWCQGAEACLLVTSGMRPNGDETTFYEACSNPIVSIVLIDANLKVVGRSVRSVDSIDTDGEHMLCSPRIVDGFASGGASGALAYVFLHRSASTAQGLATSAATVTAEVGYCYVRGNAASFPDLWKTSSALDTTSFGILAVAGDPVPGAYDGLLTMLVSRDGGFDVYSATIPPDKTFDQLVIRHNIACNETLPAVRPWPHHGTFLFTKDRPASEDPTQKDFHLYEGSFDVNKERQSGFTAKQVDTRGMKGSSFTVSPSGNFVFYNESHRDKPPENDSVGVQATAVGTSNDPSVYRIMALRYVNGKFSEDFPFCELSHPIDGIELLRIAKEASSFIITEITNANDSLANIHYVSVPNVQAAEITAFIHVEPFVYAGKSCPFQIDIMNHGNMIIGGIVVQMLDTKNGKEVGTAHVGQFEPESIRMNASNLGWGDHAGDGEKPIPTLTDEEEQGMLMPGKLMSYVVTFTIPETWRDKRTVKMVLKDIWSPPFALQGVPADDDESVVYYLHEGTDGTVKIQEAEAQASMYDPVVRSTSHTDRPEEPDNPDNPDDPDTPDNPRELPRTGDLGGVVDAVGMALGGLGALLAGYSARRVQVEREEQEAEGI